MSLRIFNTLSRTKEEFVPIDPNLIRMYRCGPTVYSHPHIGHAKSFVSFDVIRRYLMHTYGKEHLLYVMNITDVGHLAGDADEGEDKVEEQARLEHRSPFEIALEYEESFWEDMDRLNMLRPDRTPHATDFIRQQIEAIETLIEKGLAYEVNGSVYFDITEYERRPVEEGFVPYGGLSNRTTDEQEHGGRVAVKSEKRGPFDFALWKKADEKHFMQWLSPWGWGFPGWHIECSVMAKFYLGPTFDIHGGGLDNQFPHHECEIAQSQGANGKPFVRYWMHNNLVTTAGKKMGKSLGNATNMKVLFAKYDPMAIRFFILQSHYRSTLEFNEEAIEAAATGLEKLRKTIARLTEEVAKGGGNGASAEGNLPFMDAFFAAMDDDFNTPVAIGALFEGIGEVNRLLAAGAPDPHLLHGYVESLTLAFDTILGLNLFVVVEGSDVAIASDLIELLIELRKEARGRKDFAMSDVIRDRLKGLGVALEDTKEGTRWSLEG
ncbi:MAG: cysteine--tRNA ligase [Candidatus Kapaibacterium sp.]